MPPVFKRIITLFCLALFALAPLRAASAQQGQRLNLIRDAEIENAIRTMVMPIWKAAGLDPNAVEIMIVQDNSLNAFVAGGQRIFINTGLIMRTETPNQLIGVHGARKRPHRRRPSGAHAGGAAQPSARCRSSRRSWRAARWRAAPRRAAAPAAAAPADAGVGSVNAPGSLLSFLHYTQTQENSADQAAMTFLQRTGQSPKGADRVPAHPAAARSACRSAAAIPI